MAAPAARRLRRALAWAAGLLLLLLLAAAAVPAVLWWTLPDPAGLAAADPPTTALIEQRRAEAKAANRPWRPAQAFVPLERISRRLVDAVVMSEDAKFFTHRGFDWDNLREVAATARATGRLGRGASTITQQLAKNLWLGTERSLWRKGKEALLAAKLERALPKRRILALYLNVVELGEGAFGVEAGARARFGTTAAALSTAQAVVLAAMLPLPRRVDLSRHQPWFAARARHLLDRMRDERALTPDEHREASTELERLLHTGAPARGGDAEPRPADPDADAPTDPPSESDAPPPESPPADPAPAPAADPVPVPAPAVPAPDRP